MNKLFIFIISILSCSIFLVMERSIGIKWNYHPDAETYVYESPIVAITLIENGVIGFFNNFYYIVSFLLSSNITYLIILNIIIYSFTNLIIFDVLNYFGNGKVTNISFWVLVLIPYRLHLSVHILKDTLIIFFLVLIISKSFLSKGSFIFILLMRVFSVFYFVVLIPRKYYKLLFLVTIFAVIFFNDQIIEFLSEKNETNMTFREFDKVPTFSELGVVGIFIRAIIWPILTISGLFLIISPSFAFIPIAMGSFIIQWWCKFYLKSYGILIQIYFSCFLIALFVNGYTSYLRYTFPLILVTPLIQLKSIYFSKKNLLFSQNISNTI